MSAAAASAARVLAMALAVVALPVSAFAALGGNVGIG